MAYKHYIQKYPQGETTFSKVDLEETFKSLYKEFKDFAFDGEVKNVYSEDFAEKSGVNIYIPSPEDLAFKSYECSLVLLFKKDTCQDDVRTFYEYIRGQKIEYSDTFRNRYVTLVMTKQPNIEQEILYGNSPYMLVKFTFTNILGQTFATSQIS